MYVFVFEDHMLDWHSCQICYSLEIKSLLLLFLWHMDPFAFLFMTYGSIYSLVYGI